MEAVSVRREIFSRPMLTCILTGFASGLPLYVLISLLPAWLRGAGVDLKAIGLFALIQLPFTWKFLWSPLLDRFVPPFLGRRRGWMLVSQLLLIGGIGAFGFFDPRADLWTIAGLALGVSFFSASQDIVLDAFRREILSDRELGLGNTVHINAYRLASLVPGSLALVLADHLPWGSVFWITALFMLPGVGLSLWAKEPSLVHGMPKTLREAVWEPFHEFVHRGGWRPALTILLFIFLYKLGDSMATSLATPFYLDMGFTKSQIGLVAKHAGLWPSVIGGLAGGVWMLKMGINRALWVFGLVQWLTILGFALLASAGPFHHVGAPELIKLAGVIGFEALGVGLGTAAFVAFIARSTHPAYTATQFALFSSLSAVPRTLANAATGYMVESAGWTMFFLLCFVLAVPGLLMLPRVAPWRERGENES
ncbi:MAG: AmpG family muropeptide MFS transporter [Paludibacterium sp.]|uniref:AmpG family muropeptide MFS transporter n=1 Tax=Paludibacterium sp. TaxID=1917523 RepID=UPI0025D245C5|nr:AmpG family muropeptide MFS transporter [Paludibacterium sp.]MBV8047242.1 AmpG family muropeptide MFS transporter [Paludibacterium sp.]MBV8647915.1 AmpG family muropeptide MFS transporter [Paludibacterium sp.]